MTTKAGREKPILFSGAMVRAILAGNKTMTRRVVKASIHPDTKTINLTNLFGYAGFTGFYNDEVLFTKCPYGQVGSTLWVRETLKYEPDYGWMYAAGPHDEINDKYRDSIHGQLQNFSNRRVYCPSIHMPKAYSRITLDITGVRVERLQQITYDDAVAEGIDHEYPKAIVQFKDLWESINGAGSWDANPWVWVISFKRVKP